MRTLLHAGIFLSLVIAAHSYFLSPSVFTNTIRQGGQTAARDVCYSERIEQMDEPYFQCANQARIQINSVRFMTSTQRSCPEQYYYKEEPVTPVVPYVTPALNNEPRVIKIVIDLNEQVINAIADKEKTTTAAPKVTKVPELLQRRRREAEIPTKSTIPRKLFRKMVEECCELKTKDLECCGKTTKMATTTVGYETTNGYETTKPIKRVRRQADPAGGVPGKKSSGKKINGKTGKKSSGKKVSGKGGKKSTTKTTKLPIRKPDMCAQIECPACKYCPPPVKRTLVTKKTTPRVVKKCPEDKFYNRDITTAVKAICQNKIECMMKFSWLPPPGCIINGKKVPIDRKFTMIKVSYSCQPVRPYYRNFANKRYDRKWKPNYAHPNRGVSYNRMENV